MKVLNVRMFLVFLVLATIVVAYSMAPEPAFAQSQNYGHFPQLAPKAKPQPPDPVQELEKKFAEAMKTVQELSLQVAEARAALAEGQKQMTGVQNHIAVCKCGHQDQAMAVGEDRNGSGGCH